MRITLEVIEISEREIHHLDLGVALDRLEMTDMGEAIQTPSGDFSDTLITRETSELEPDVVELIYFAAGIGLIQEEDLKLEHSRFVE